MKPTKEVKCEECWWHRFPEPGIPYGSCTNQDVAFGNANSARHHELSEGGCGLSGEYFVERKTDKDSHEHRCEPSWNEDFKIVRSEDEDQHWDLLCDPVFICINYCPRCGVRLYGKLKRKGNKILRKEK